MSNGFLDSIFGTKTRYKGFENYVDLENIDYEQDVEDEGPSIKVAEVREMEDATLVKEQIYSGNIVVIDISAIMNDEKMRERIVTEIQYSTKDVGGDIAGIGEKMVIATPAGVKIDRRIIGGGDFR
ncbi:putative cell division protein SepF-like [Methanonatronarchaeum thermophilum]|uniref:Putative cell division protein SepF-like n=1 Tax=Methanonatronarchaeum thermophilum TaxID=1927129 RepID=A0A1Y3GGR8_9EURY|nr:cell division protein SepF [Methanonatronarchaeum thermophilum]OUJ19394.1 putative cell division protein SepF-like [Methanonatronarchaeum thermophilum]